MNGNEMNFEYTITKLKNLIEYLERLKITRLEAAHGAKHIRHMFTYPSEIQCVDVTDRFVNHISRFADEARKERETQGKM